VRIRDSLVQVHLWVGLITAPFLVVLGLTGALLVFENQINDALNVRLTRVTPAGAALSISELETRIRATYPGYRVVDVDFPPDAAHSRSVGVVSPDGKRQVQLFVDPYTGRVLGTGAQEIGVMRVVHALHTHLQAGSAGSTIVGALGLVLLFLACSGLWLWWPAKIFRMRWSGTTKRVVFEAHNALGVYAWVFLMLFSLTGAVIHWDGLVGGWIERLAPAPAPVPAIPDTVAACTGQAALPLDRLLGPAAAAVPGAAPSWIQANVDPSKPVRIAFKYPEDHTPAGRTRVYLAGCSAQVLAVRNARTMPLSYRYAQMWNREIHTGDLLGWPTRILAALFSLSLPLMALTGPLIWWTRRRRAARAPAGVPRSSSPAVDPSSG
jgi:uncharacterized iron-regulated membrane protein